MTTNAQNTPTIYDVKPGDVVAIIGHMGAETVITATKAFEHDSAMHLTDETGWKHTLYENTRFRFVHRAHR
ncbi:hypothetical protein [Nocardiopsis sp. FR26]|uniref:hypothetical protein n=1 Tax=Nocardiopsis sp. FR26 TaxID=2605987 RepID=UPI001359A2A6|nr:hypothetical protein [Nocardiopsis sp. FR26]